MQLKDTTHRNVKVIADPDWSNEYRIHMSGNIFYRHVGEAYNWIPVVGQGAREDVWNKARLLNWRIHWRQENDTDPVVPGFRRVLGKLAVWYICNACNVPFSDTPENIRDAQEKGCTQPLCTNKIDAKE